MPARDRTLLEITLIATAVDRGLVLRDIKFQHASHRARQKLPIVADQDDPATQIPHELFESVQAVEVEIVGGLVEQDDIEPGQHQGRQSDPGRLATRKTRHERGIRLDVQCQIRQDHRQPLLQIRRTGSQPVIQRRAVGIRSGIGFREFFRRSLHGDRSGRASGPPRDIGRDALTGDTFMLLR